MEEFKERNRKLFVEWIGSIFSSIAGVYILTHLEGLPYKLLWIVLGLILQAPIIYIIVANDVLERMGLK